MDVATLWIESLEAAYALARGERLNDMNGVYVKRFDARGVHPFSAAWGAVQAAETLEPVLASEGVATSAHALVRAAREDAEQTYRAECVAALQAALS